ncbi:hypothetical protein B0T20DRAFT_394940 [Sordaria brevicollis]|uniref:Uncharacterized protein n=1 Tax=Sordaria brevicollis TaxID=83679 RepID=A0AAE0PAN8_SORBR|nr:hypothetical protein B0T20DRAFT_394940 [Sordaria brevicollis]
MQTNSSFLYVAAYLVGFLISQSLRPRLANQMPEKPRGYQRMQVDARTESLRKASGRTATNRMIVQSSLSAQGGFQWPLVTYHDTITFPSTTSRKTTPPPPPYNPTVLAKPAVLWLPMWIPALGSMARSVQQGAVITIVANMQFDEPSQAPCHNPSQCPLAIPPKFDFGINEADLGGDLFFGARPIHVSQGHASRGLHE